MGVSDKKNHGLEILELPKYHFKTHIFIFNFWLGTCDQAWSIGGFKLKVGKVGCCDMSTRLEYTFTTTIPASMILFSFDKNFTNICAFTHTVDV